MQSKKKSTNKKTGNQNRNKTKMKIQENIIGIWCPHRSVKYTTNYDNYF